MADPNKTLFGDSDDSDADTPAADSQVVCTHSLASYEFALRASFLSLLPRRLHPNQNQPHHPRLSTPPPRQPHPRWTRYASHPSHQVNKPRAIPQPEAVQSGAPAESLSSSGIGVKADAGVDDEDPEPFQLPDPNPAFQIEVCNPAVQVLSQIVVALTLVSRTKAACAPSSPTKSNRRSTYAPGAAVDLSCRSHTLITQTTNTR